MALRRGTDGASLSDQDIGPAHISTAVTAAAAGGVPCLIDAWGYPLAFTRWPLGNNLAPAYIVPANPEPSDPQGLISDATKPATAAWLSSIGAYDFDVVIHALHLVPANGVPGFVATQQNLRKNTKWSDKLSPVVASPGSKGVLGLEILIPSTTIGPTHWQVNLGANPVENIYGFDVLP
jgi:hypothetical protein